MVENNNSSCRLTVVKFLSSPPACYLLK
uniref:Uncharacterized protein n=1 Tax=Anguilla anguilla TaxID=7936 RepID=A0A0E9PK76_ANGAN